MRSWAGDGALVKRKGKKIAQKPDFVVNRQAVCVSVSVDDPGYQRQHDGAKGNTRQVNATINIRESPLVWYATHGNIEADESRAGDWVRRLHELAGGAGVQAMDYEREPVDGGKISDGLTDLKATSAKRLIEARDELERNGLNWRIVEDVCAWGYFVKQISTSKRENAIMMQDLRNSLGCLAVFWGYRSAPPRRKRA